jgi:hypothetical protein
MQKLTLKRIDAAKATFRAEYEAWRINGDRGRDAHYWAPPAQIRTCPIKAYGSHLGWLTAKRLLGHG